MFTVIMTTSITPVIQSGTQECFMGIREKSYVTRSDESITLVTSYSAFLVTGTNPLHSFRMTISVSCHYNA